MSAQKTSDGIPVSELATQLREEGRPLCPQFRPCKVDTLLYPVRGHCVRSCRPGLLMIPSIEEYGTYCTSLEFARCCWFGEVGEPRGWAADEHGEQWTRREATWSAEVNQPRLRGSA